MSIIQPTAATNCRKCVHFTETRPGAHCLIHSLQELQLMGAVSGDAMPAPEDMTCEDFEPP